MRYRADCLLAIPALAPALMAASYAQDVAPVFARYCVQCHGQAIQMGGLDLSTPESMLRGGSKGPALVKSGAAKSLLYQRISDRSMPPGPSKLPAFEAEKVRAWIDAGAESSGPAAAPQFSSHWAYQPPRRPVVPRPGNRAWIRTPVDAFVLAKLEESGISPVAPASKTTLLRRVALSLTGLPPAPEDEVAFFADQAQGALDRFTERMLAKPAYGERWARRWLDVVRYAESNGYERDGTKPHAWRYRDYVIDAFNKDKPYDRFVTEQLAGDELDGTDAETQIATTFLRLGTWDDEPAEPVLDRYDQLDDILGTTSASLLGITLRCARCHDHKFEPFSQKDYYRVLAIFSPLNRPQDKRTDLDRLAGTEAEIRRFEESKAKADAEVSVLDRKIDGVKKTIQRRVIEAAKQNNTPELRWLEHLETVLAFQVEAARRNKRQKELVEKFNLRLDAEIDKQAKPDERAQIDGWKSEIALANAARVPEPPRAYVWYEDSKESAATRLLERGDVSKPAEVVQPGVPGVFGIPAASIEPRTKSTGRRLWLARWLTDPDNPLLARVMVNRIWQAHFGEGLVVSESDFGVMGQRPTHPELLDWLAREFIESGWRVKHIQRLIVNSNTFQLSPEWREAAGKRDPEGKLLWRWKPRRLDAEIVRDSMFVAAGTLNPAMHGPSIYPQLPRAVLEGQSVPGQNWGNSEGAAANRRSIYIHVKRSLAVPELELLDAPDTTASCEQRSVSTTGPQALTFLNGDFAHARARELAARVEGVIAEPATRIDRLFRIVLGREASAGELRSGVEFLQSAGPKALENFALVLLNSNEFVYLN